ncbi:hypothetical protein K505DRAFT_262013, partial [Melanomma pulvis-pyrius CBS 109.77]
VETMDGKNSCGRRISLLNDSAEPALQPFRLPSFTPSLGSRTSSYSSSPVGSPPTPHLVRSNSSDSSDSAAMQTPSPITPEFSFDGMASPVFAQASFFPVHKDLRSAYPPIPHTGPLPYHTPGAADAAYFGSQQPAEPRPASASASSSANPRSKKNSYPCPMAKQFSCNDYFTTSGHAARHAKKHTGKKDAFCPECNKAFTRKDNMEQHRRTHQSGRNTAKAGDSSAKKTKQHAKRPKPAPIQSAMPPLSMMDPSLSTSPSGANFVMAPAVQPVDSFCPDVSQPSLYPDPTAFPMTHSYSVGSSYGLDALAIAASGEKRKFEP